MLTGSFIRNILLATASVALLFVSADERVELVRRSTSVPTTCKTRGQIAITFDGGPSESRNTGNVLESLRNTFTKATFHVITKYLHIDRVRNALLTMKQDGQLIGLRFPPDLNPMSLSDGEIQDVLAKDAKRVFDIVGVWPKYLRLPAQQYDQRVLNAVRVMGFVVTEASILPIDAYVSTQEQSVAQEVVDAYTRETLKVGEGEGSFISRHQDTNPVYDGIGFVVYFTRIVRTHGYKYVKLSECLLDSDYMASAPVVTVSANTPSPSSPAASKGTDTQSTSSPATLKGTDPQSPSSSDPSKGTNGRNNTSAVGPSPVTANDQNSLVPHISLLLAILLAISF